MKIPQVSVFVSNRPGRLQAVCKSLADAGVNLLSLTLADSGEFGLIRLIVSDPEKSRGRARESGTQRHHHRRGRLPRECRHRWPRRTALHRGR